MKTPRTRGQIPRSGAAQRAGRAQVTRKAFSSAGFGVASSNETLGSRATPSPRLSRSLPENSMEGAGYFTWPVPSSPSCWCHAPAGEGNQARGPSRAHWSDWTRSRLDPLRADQAPIGPDGRRPALAGLGGGLGPARPRPRAHGSRPCASRRRRAGSGRAQPRRGP